MRVPLFLTGAALLVMTACDRPAEVSDRFFQERERAVFAAFEKRAASEIEKLYGEDFVAINADGSITDKRQAVEAARTNALGIDEIKSDEFRVRRYNDTALVTGRSTYLKAGREVGQVRHTMTWAKIGDDWKLVGWQGTPAADILPPDHK